MKILCHLPLILLFAASAVAQPHQESGLFFDAGAFASLDFTTRSEMAARITQSVESDDLTAGGLVSAGVFLQRFLSVRADVIFTGARETVNRFESGSTVPTFTEVGPAGITFGSPTSRSTIVSRSTRFEVHALLAYHLPSARRVRVAILGGPSFVRTSGASRTEEVTDEIRLGGVIVLPRTSEVFSSSGVGYSRGTTVGLEGEIRLSSRITVTTRMALTAFGSTWSLRPHVNVRWSP